LGKKIKPEVERTMDSFVEKWRLKEMAEEDIYFARRDLELIEALHQRQLTQRAPCDHFTQKQEAKAFEDRYAALSSDANTATEHTDKRRQLLQSLRQLVDDILGACKRQHD
jgi:hypothetical protein